jgi:histidinol-phosphate aminotransferase
VSAVLEYAEAELRDRNVRVRMHRNESPLPPPEFVLEAVRAVSPEVLRTYPAELAVEVRDALASRLALAPASVLLTNGADEALLALGRAFPLSDRRIVTVTPTFGMYARAASLAGANLWRIPYRTRWTLDYDAIAAVAARGDAVILGHPNNPTGDLLDRERVRELAAALPETTLIVDEVYLAFSERSLAELSALPNVAVVGSLSKIASLAGMRVGFVAARPETIERVRRVVQPFPVAALSLVAAGAYLRGGERTAAFEDALRACVARSLDAISAAIAPFARACWRGPANFLLADLGADRERVLAALTARGVAVRTYPDAELATCVRLCPVDDAQTAAFLEALASVEPSGA